MSSLSRKQINQEHHHITLEPNDKIKMVLEGWIEMWLPFIDKELDGADIDENGVIWVNPIRPCPTYIPSRSPIDLPIALEPWIQGKHVFHAGVCNGNLMPSWIVAGAESISGVEISAECIYNLLEVAYYYDYKENTSLSHQNLGFSKRSKFAMGNFWTLFNGAQTQKDMWEDKSIPKIFPTHELHFSTGYVRENIKERWWPWMNNKRCAGQVDAIVDEWNNSDVIFCWSLRDNRANKAQIKELKNSLGINSEDMSDYEKALIENPSALDGLYLAQKVKEQTNKPKIIVRMHSRQEYCARLEGDDVVSFNSFECAEFSKAPWFRWPEKTSREWIEGEPLWLSLTYVNFTADIWKEKYPDIPVPKSLVGVK